MKNVAEIAARAATHDPNRRAIELLEPSLAAEVIARMKGARMEAPQGLGGAEGGQTESIATLWFADDFYDELGTGRIEGLPTVTWNGVDAFIFRQNPERPFRYITAGGRAIEPQIMETDGGSIPRLLQGFAKFSSWGYGPAYIIHDWLFVAEKCRYAPDTDFTLESAGRVMAEIMKTLMEVGFTNYDGHVARLTKAEDTLYVMYQAVISGIAEELWDAADSVRCLR